MTKYLLALYLARNKDKAVIVIDKNRLPAEGDTITVGNMQATWVVKE